MPPSTSPSPSPPPTKPTTSTPGPRAAALQTLHQKTLAATLDAISYDSFAACFPQIAARAPGSLRAMHGEFVGRLGGFAKEEFIQILQERNVIANLNNLDTLISDARSRKLQSQSSLPSSSSSSSNPKPPPPHTLPPTTLLRAHLHSTHASQQSQLNARLQTTESQNADLARRLQEQRAEIEGLVAAVEGVVGDLERAGRELSERGEGEGGLSAAGREAEGVLRQ